MTAFDKQRFADWLHSNALPAFGARSCAAYIRMALEAAGCDTTGHPVSAKDWGPTLLRIGFVVISTKNYAPTIGDIIVMQGTTDSIDGHIEGYDGHEWVSDFVQRDMWPGPSFRAETPAYAIYRFP